MELKRSVNAGKTWIQISVMKFTGLLYHECKNGAWEDAAPGSL